ncbi:hypothetical protein Rleg9DRAFT_5955 [Rhizobium leguminosarum bv. trifolii WSM597]|uniref:Uncharacterized protein n=1 Tax=Rhizobium leguminosarum bv. trifolii WSM597 TaxID=754764 RepID=I9XD49_RHILT|nr:hypothetical protein [Rhizobium leguminosarum]EJB06986.1 hypothetical protein Rleg9DRAFT_5955 [Rhizobium leguminosarum bv. trifolii WSM597]
MRPISIQIPAELFIEFAARVKGDPSEEIELLVRKHLTSLDEVVQEANLFRTVTSKEFNDGDPSGGMEWSPLWLPNGTDLRMRYRQKTYLAKVRFDAIHFGDLEYHSVSQWVRQIARGTARNAWHDVWVKFQDSDDFVYADTLRQVPRTGFPPSGESRAARIIRLGAISLPDDEDTEGNKK